MVGVIIALPPKSFWASIEVDSPIGLLIDIKSHYNV